MVGLTAAAVAPAAVRPAEAASPLLSAQWYRVASLKPRLSPQARIERLPQRGQVWHLLARADGSRSFRLNPGAWAFAGRCDGRISVQALWDVLLAEQVDDAPTQDELLQLMTQLHAAGLLTFDRPPAFARTATTSVPLAPDVAPRRAQSLLSFQVPLGRPDAWLSRLAPRCKPLFTRQLGWAWLALVALGAVLAALHLAELTAFASAWLGSPRLVLMTWLAYPVVKAAHELAHALALKHFGAAVPEWGITLMAFTPVPYVDASAATQLPERHQRFIVSAAGIVLELGLAAAALCVALNAEAGLWRDLAYSVFFIGSVSTLLVNGNPLLRFDGYHMLTDALALPNLASRSTRFWLEHLRQRLLAVPVTRPLQPAPGEAAWLWGHAPAALAYRVGVSLSLVGWLAHWSGLLGWLAGAYLVWLMLAKPAWALWQWLSHPLNGEALRDQGRRRLVGLLVAAALLAGAVPLPHASVAQGVVWLPEQAQVRAATDGLVAAVPVADGQTVQRGELLIQLQDPDLAAERLRLDGLLAALDTERFQALRRDPSRAVALSHELAAAQAEWDRVNEREQHLAVRAGADGPVALAHATDLPGRHVRQGAVLAQIMTGQPTTVRVALPQDQARLVQADTRAVSVWLDEASDTAWSADLPSRVAGAVQQLPSAALGDRHGGQIVTDPADAQGLTPAQAVVLVDVQLAQAVSPRSGGRAWVRFDHGWSPWLMQAARRLQQAFLAHFNPAQ